MTQRVDSVESGDGLRFVRVDYLADCRMPVHRHEDATSLNFCLKGSLEETCGRETVAFGPSSLSLMPAGMPHANRFAAGASAFLVVLDERWTRRMRAVSSVLESPLRRQGGRATWLAARLHREFQVRDDLTGLALEGILLELLVELARGSDVGDAAAPRWLDTATDYLHARFAAPVSTADIAATVGVHPAHLMRAFRRRHRCTIGEYVRRLRLDYACHRMVSADDALGQIAREAGFSDQSHFNRAFKGRFGITPGEFLRNKSVQL